MESSALSPPSLYSDDDLLNNTWKDTEKPGSVSPTLKEELRLSIMTKRIKNKQTPIDTTPRQESVQFQLTDEEIQRKERRREQNRRAAERCREKKKKTQGVKEKEKDILLRNNKELIGKVYELKLQLAELKKVYNDHVDNGLCFRNNCSVEPVTPVPEDPVAEVSNRSSNIPTVVTEKLRLGDESWFNSNTCFSANCTENLDESATTTAPAEYVTDSCAINSKYAAVTVDVQKDPPSYHGSSSFPNDCSLNMTFIDNCVSNIDYTVSVQDSSYGNRIIADDIIDDLSDFSLGDQEQLVYNAFENARNDFPVSNSYPTPIDLQYDACESTAPSMYCENDNTNGAIAVIKDNLNVWNEMGSEDNPNIPDISDKSLEELSIEVVNDPQLYALIRNFDI